ncbi:hypothetical protein [Jidongwangia harbinensis]|uniref:hypothetical protein n=1 Tax=Jidongwangia harbinensis TaxID=2878561 RepID=UPI001CD92802|nr:hypothetical protein [Jidongwangia harbinensis]MCA2211922.1 hypothetical protein [Jidongwangia harbinensis]
MLVIGKVGRTVGAALCAVVLAAGCSSDDAPEPPDGGTIDVTTMRDALLQAADIGPTWKPPANSADPERLVAFCGGAATVPPVPPGAEVVVVPLVDEGTKGAQSLHQAALVYPDATAAKAGLAALRAVADGCPADVNQPATQTADRNEPAYTETTSTTDLTEGGWTGFVVTRHKQYEPKHPGTADAAVAVLTKQNVLFVDAYAVYRLGTASSGPAFDSDWKKLVGTVLNRVG